ncbi:putative PEP-binding protein [Leptolyngbya sp. FACHB-711]|uniref:putative PEP-binding protein n=1 Tax=unclassified Leptolyngbya TaxID=2650499 RepID=UPI001682B624|nr:putative PEP-binding protein [Leptolyngbya sp. FACHB-711]MBD1851266.1 phosphoenolpyruvate synthase [Cyanobacteria bacterium FACHB-502]MBD2026961.1 phosphoenolpyruvate synthase [Leptolyngbya sp. FACHB-711]
MSVDYFFWLDQIQPHHRDRVGSKAFYLAVLRQRGYPVVPGLVVSNELFQAFLSQLEWADPTFADLPALLRHLDVDNPRQLQGVAQQLRHAVTSTAIPKSWLLPINEAIRDWQSSQQTEAVILRPSFSLASGLDPSISDDTRSLLEAKICRAEPESIAHALKWVWAELFRARSLLYWQRLGVEPQQVQLAVLIQPIRSPIAAGKAVVQGNELRVQTVWGLGHGMTGGVTPDCYRVDAAGIVYFETISRKNVAYGIVTETSEQALLGSFPVGGSEQDDSLQLLMLKPEQQTQPVLTRSQVERLAQLTRQLMLTLGMAVELEWMLCSGAVSGAVSEAVSEVVSEAVSEAEFGDRGSEPSFYITRVIPYSTLTPKFLAPAPLEMDASEIRETASDRLKGIAAAPGKVTATVWVIPLTPVPLLEMPPGCVLVAPIILPEWVSQIRQVGGIVTEQGGTTSHGAILARELGIPAVVGIAGAMQTLKTGDQVLINGDRGEVIRMLEPAAFDEPDDHDNHRAAHADLRIEATRYQGNSTQIMPATATRLMVSLSQTESIAQISELPIDGVGLLRSELLWIKSLEDRSPDEWLAQDKAGLIDRLAQQIQQFADRMMPRPVFYRSLDMRAHEFPMLAGSSVERNPVLGLRGAYRYQIYPGWFGVELAALRQVQQASFDNLRLILPFVRTVEEFIFCRDRVTEAGLWQPGFELWMMAEVPSILLLLPAYIEAGVQGMAIGCNDLTQLLLGIDRDHPQMATQFNMTHPAVMQAIQQIVQASRAAELPCTVCGHLPRNLNVIDRLVEWGVTGISVEPGDVAWMSQALDRAERRLILEGVRRVHS